MKLPSGSKLELASRCLHPFTSGLPWPAWTGSAQADFGTAVHAAAERMLSGPVNLAALATEYRLGAPERRRLDGCAYQIADYLAALAADGWVCWPEVPVAYHVERGTSRMLRSAGPRDYSDKRPGEVTATLDLVCVRHGEVMAVDYKTGRALDHDGEESTWQMRLAGLALARLLGAGEVTVALAYVDDGGIRTDAATLGAFDVDATAADLRALWARLHAGPAEPVPGAHCTVCYCPVLGKCAATARALATVRDEGLLAALHEPGAAARALALLPIAEARLAAVRDELKTIATREPIRVGPGKVWGAVEQSRETVALDTPGAVDILREHLGARAEEAVELSTSKAAIERAAGGKKAARPVLDALRAAGAVRVSGFVKFVEFERKEQEAAE